MGREGRERGGEGGGWEGSTNTFIKSRDFVFCKVNIIVTRASVVKEGGPEKACRAADADHARGVTEEG